MPTRHAPVAFVILAAGLGSRLSHVINDVPKWMAPISAEQTLAEHQLASLRAAVAPGQPQVVISGAKGHAISELAVNHGPLSVVFNANFEAWNNWSSFLLALEHLAAVQWDGPIMVVNGDLFCPADWFADFADNLADTNDPITLAVDPHHPLTDEAMKVSDNAGTLRQIGKVDVVDPFAEFIGLTGLTQEGARIMADYLRGVQREERYDAWYEGALQDAAHANVPIALWQTPFDDWVEIDNADDLVKAQAIALGAA